MRPSPRRSLGLGLAAGCLAGLALAIALGRHGPAAEPWAAFGVGLGALIAFLAERR